MTTADKLDNRIIKGTFAFSPFSRDPLPGIISHNLENQSSYSVHLY